jgi:hypothetical protein
MTQRIARAYAFVRPINCRAHQSYPEKTSELIEIISLLKVAVSVYSHTSGVGSGRAGRLAPWHRFARCVGERNDLANGDDNLHGELTIHKARPAQPLCAAMPPPPAAPCRLAPAVSWGGFWRILRNYHLAQLHRAAASGQTKSS